MRCDAGSVCHGAYCMAGCGIDGVYYALDTINPTNRCQSCQPSRSTGSWSPLSGDTCVQAIAVGCGYSCAILGGGVQCWGDNSSGQLGNDSTVDSTVPVKVLGLQSGVQAIALGFGGCGGQYSCALVDGGVQCWARYLSLGHVSRAGPGSSLRP